MLNDVRIRSAVVQTTVVAIVLGVIYLMAMTASENLLQRGIPLGLEFLQYRAGFTISESLLPYETSDLYIWAAVVGIGNTLFVWFVVAVMSTVLGTLLGVARLSENPLVSGLSRVWVESARNTPPILMLIFLYSAWWVVLPSARQALGLGQDVYLSIRGLVFPSVSLGWGTAASVVAIVISIAALFAARQLAKRKHAQTGVRPPYVPVVFAAILTAFCVALFFSRAGLLIDRPVFQRTNFRGGITVTPELITIILGLTYYTTGFVAEIVRSGILAVHKGQWEAARALGLREGKVLQLVIIPQTMRVILPPMTSQYINLVKNTTLAIAVGYPDFMMIVTTIINRTSHAIEGVVLIILGYLLINLSLSAALNWYNARVGRVER
ncbi:MAG TPA: ABC transporter permease subunit [Alphaproteobacteria bacterium]|nr:ABC transporter permease subunit [Alphaproteobacteria bacterium]